MENVRPIHMGVPYYLQFESEDENPLTVDNIAVYIYIPTQNKRYRAILSDNDGDSLIEAAWTAEQTNEMVQTAPTLEVYSMENEEIIDIMLREENFTPIRKVAMSNGVKEGD